MSSYVVWANKGGIGKSTMTFQLACAAAHANPDKKVFVIDLSPQCDVSRMVLGGGHFGGENKILATMQANPRKTIQSYLLDCLNDVPSGIGWPDPKKYIIKPNSVRDPNAQPLPSNLRLLCGDFDLERTIQLIDQLPQPPRRTGRAPTGPEYSTYLLTRSFLRHAVQVLDPRSRNIIFIDTDPYFNVITTQMGLVAADNWISAYSPSSQASQFAVLRSIEFMFDPSSGLHRFISDERARFPNPWFDNRGNALTAPAVAVSSPFLLLANMTNPYRRSGNQRYTDPQRLHQQTVDKMKADAGAEASSYGIPDFSHYEHMWDIRRLGLICDYNGIELDSLQLGNNYSEPGSLRQYHLNATGGTPDQLDGYQRRLTAIATLL
ncbi:ParA family protein [Burkholderia pseudomallei]|uniref:ParA family protein n=1 Tax=Burkholderia pseudomallei TaxID=28450 RepID=UPI000531EE08|nr:AAA family ATPase [Burkholderia pseudomallei]KGS71092.1 4Fe-4S iron sulfur cluster binding s, NifH/frxC family protein [Burkholderia pseudomallei MSHR7527]